MKSALRIKRRSIFIGVVVCVVCYLVALIIFGRFTVFDGWNFKGQESQDSGSEASVTMSVNTKVRAYSAPGFRRKVYATSKRPYDLNLRIYAGPGNYQTAIVNRVTLRYEDGEVVDVVAPNETRRWLFQERRYPTWNGNETTDEVSLSAGGTLTNCVLRNSPCTVELHATLLGSAGEGAPVSSVWKFTPTKTRGFVPDYYLEFLREGSPSGYPGP